MIEVWISVSGSKDAHTSMWMRDAYMNDNIPELDKMDRPQYFPGRFGPDFWAYFGGSYGDSLIKPFFLEEVAKRGLTNHQKMCPATSLQIPLSKNWQQTLSRHYKKQVNSKCKRCAGQVSMTKFRWNQYLSTLSPDGILEIAFSFWKRSVYYGSLSCWYSSGKILRKLLTITTKEGHIDQLNSIESAGSWSPDMRSFFSTFKWTFCAFD